jgi:hypothetical protein
MTESDGYIEKDGKLHVSVEYLRWLQEERRKINKTGLKNVVLYEDGVALDIPEKRIRRFEFIGLSNIDFVLMDLYKDPMENDAFYDSMVPDDKPLWQGEDIGA